MTTRLKLRAIVYGCDFRKNEVTIYEAFRESPQFPGELRSGEAYLFVSGGENQLIWFLKTFALTTSTRVPVGVTHTQRSRLDSRSPWNPLMLQEYAKAVDIELAGIRSFEQAYREQRERKSKCF